jgi:cellulose biosynthesis protein BcsQ
MVDRRKRLHSDIIAATPVHYPAIVSAAIPSAIDVERMGIHRGPVSLFAPRSAAAKAYCALWTETRRRVGL